MSPSPPPALVKLSLGFALVWHLAAVGSPAWVLAGVRESSAKDFASFYYASAAVSQGEDPYDRAALNRLARQASQRGGVHPFFYPPPFLLAMTWTQHWSLLESYRIWFWLDELSFWACWGLLVGWWRAWSPWVAPVAAVGFALFTAVPNNHLMGQMNLPALALSLAGLWAVDQRRPLVGGSLLGLACMWKMSPALLVAWWILRRENLAVVAAVTSALLVSLATLPLLDLQAQLHFYRDVLPRFGSGDYNGLTVEIDLFGNHSVPNLWFQAFPAPDGLGDAARRGSNLTLLALLGGLGWWFRAPPPTPAAQAAQVATVGVALLLVPVYTYEHHLVWALPAVVVAVVAVAEGRLSAAWAVGVAVSAAVLAFSLAELKSLAGVLPGPLAFVVQELKFVALLVLAAACARLGRGASAPAAEAAA